MKKILVLLLLLVSIALSGQTIVVKNEVFEVLYSQDLEQPLMIRYRSTNRPTKVNRCAMDFYTEKGINTSDAEDYKANIFIFKLLHARPIS